MSKMSAPSPIIRLACLSAAAGSRKHPLSEKESGVTLSTPITSGRPSASSRASQSGDSFSRTEPLTGRTSVMLVALRRAHERCQAPGPFRSLTVGDFLRQFFSVLDPAHHELFGRKKANQLSLPVGVGHGFGEPRGVAIPQLLEGIDAHFAQKSGIFHAHAFDAQLVGDIGPAQELPFIKFGLGGEVFAPFRILRSFEQLLRRSNPNGFERLSLVRIDIFDGADRIGHGIFLAPGERRHQTSDGLAKAGDGDLADCGMTPPVLSATARSASFMTPRHPAKSSM